MFGEIVVSETIVSPVKGFITFVLTELTLSQIWAWIKIEGSLFFGGVKIELPYFIKLHHIFLQPTFFKYNKTKAKNT